MTLVECSENTDSNKQSLINPKRVKKSKNNTNRRGKKKRKKRAHSEMESTENVVLPKRPKSKRIKTNNEHSPIRKLYNAAITIKSKIEECLYSFTNKLYTFYNTHSMWSFQ